MTAHKIEDLHGVFANYFQHIAKVDEMERSRVEERELNKQEIKEKTAAKLSPDAKKLYLFIKNASISFWGENGSAMLSVDREEWRKLESYIKELEQND